MEGKTGIITYEICYRFTCYFYGYDFEGGKFVGAGIKFELGRYHRERR
jgi:hypothetical protein